jgi:cytidine deaminase
LEKIIQELIKKATKARLNSYAPYSKFSVGAAVMTDDGTIFSGCNIENVSLGLSMCAERVAIYKAITAGYRIFKVMAVMCDTKEPCTPCGACRQVMVEFSPEMDIVMTNLHHKVKIKKARELLPGPFHG